MNLRGFKSLGRLAAVALLGALLSACGGGEEPAAQPAPEERRTPVTVTEARIEPVEVTTVSVGEVTSKAAPTVSAEVAGRVTEVLVDVGASVTAGQVLARLEGEDYQLELNQAQAEVQRLEALVRNQRRLVERQESLVAENFISDAMLDETRAQLDALQEQLAGARSALEAARRDLDRTRVRAPMAGQVVSRQVAEGDYVAAGEPLFTLTTQQALRVTLPFPETLAGQLRPGLPVRLWTPVPPRNVVEATVTELRPQLGRGNLALDVIVELQNPGGWRPGASVNGEVVLERRDAVVVPEESVVRRPAGRVVYVVEGEGEAAVVQARTVDVGVRKDGLVEIHSGLDAGAAVVVDGAGFLTDGARVRVQEAPQQEQEADP